MPVPRRPTAPRPGVSPTNWGFPATYGWQFPLCEHDGGQPPLCASNASQYGATVPTEATKVQLGCGVETARLHTVSLLEGTFLMPDVPQSATTIYTAREIVTMSGYLPTATAVMVRDGWIICVGTVEDCLMWDAGARIDDTFAEHVLVPGFVEAHGHTAQGAFSALPHAGYFDMPQPDGTVAPGVTSYDELLDLIRSRHEVLPPDELILVNNFDPIYFADQPRLSKTHLDTVSATRPIAVRHASGHLLTVNSAVLQANGITAATDTPGVDKGDDGEPTGELQEPPAMTLAADVVAEVQRVGTSLQGVADYGRLARDAGVTTSTELVGAMLLMPEVGPAWKAVVDAEGYPMRLVMYNLAAVPGSPFDADSVAQRSVDLRELNSDRFRVQGVKSVLDGSIQGWTALMRSPGYLTGEDQGLLTEDPDRLVDLLIACNRARVNVHAHCNGNASGDVFIDAVERALLAAPWLDHRHNLTHSQTTTSAQYRKMAKLGICASIFTNHIYYWGDQHYAQTMGPELTQRMWAHRTALDAGVVISLHSDAGVTPVGMLTPMWCAVNRLTASGRVLGEAEKITPYEALWAVTLGAAYQLHMDAEIGSIEAGKRADFAVLSDNPLTVDPAAIKDIAVWGTVLSGVPSQRGS